MIEKRKFDHMDFPYVIYVVQNRGDDATVAAEEVGSGVVFHVKVGNTIPVELTVFRN